MQNHLNGITAEFKSFMQKVRMVIQPAIMAVPALLAWVGLYEAGYRSDKFNDEPVINAILPFISSAYVFLASFLLFREGNDVRDMKTAIKNKDKNAFLAIARDRIPAPVKYILFATGTIIILWTIFLHYESFWTGLASVYSTTYIIVLVWEVIIDLDDPINGVWVIKNIPEEWMEEAHLHKRNSDRFFDTLFGN